MTALPNHEKFFISDNDSFNNSSLIFCKEKSNVLKKRKDTIVKLCPKSGLQSALRLSVLIVDYISFFVQTNYGVKSMSNERFIKFIPSEEAFWLLHNKPNAFRLLTHIANTARRYNGYPDGLIIGQCHLKKWTEYNFTEQEYRTAKDILVMRKHIVIISTNRTRQKSTTGSTTASTLVELCSSTVYDINPDVINDRINDRATTDQRQTRKKKKEEEEIKEKLKKENLPIEHQEISLERNITYIDRRDSTPILKTFPITPEKKIYAPFVDLTLEEHDTLLQKFGNEKLAWCIENLSNWSVSKSSTPKGLKEVLSHTVFYRLTGWVSREYDKIHRVTKQKNNSKTSSKGTLQQDFGYECTPAQLRKPDLGPEVA